MIDASIQTELLKQIEQLPIDQQRNVLDFVRNLVKARSSEPPKHFLDLFGTLPSEDANEMIQAIEEGCERIDANEW